MEENNQKKQGLFREKSLEAIESPEKLNDYLHVTSPGVWLIMAAAIVLLAGFVLWAIFGRIDTKVVLAVSTQENRTVCYVPFEELENVTKAGRISIDGKSYALKSDMPHAVRVDEEMNPYLRLAGGLEIGDIVVEITVDASLSDNIRTGSVVTESLQPMSLLFK